MYTEAPLPHRKAREDNFPEVTTAREPIDRIHN
jgi:hypothetical protein